MTRLHCNITVTPAAASQQQVDLWGNYQASIEL